MKVILAHKFFKLTGGAEVFFRETERVLRENGHETMMVATGETTQDAPENLRLMQAPAYDSGGTLQKALSLPRAIYDPSKKRQMADLIREFDPDILHTFSINVHLSPAILSAAAKASVPIVGTFNDYKHICPNYKLFHHNRLCTDCLGGKFYKAAANSCCKESRALSIASMAEAYIHSWIGAYDNFSHITFSSDFMAHETEKFWAGRNFSWSKMRNPFDSASFQPSDEYEPYGLYFGRIIDEKGVDRIVDAARDIHPFEMRIVGDGPDLDKLRQRADRENLSNIRFLGPLWGDALTPVLSRARFVVVPSLWHENFPYVINQAFALARPVIGARRGGITELVADGERGLIFDPDTPGALAGCINQLARNEDEARQMGQRAKVYSDANFNDTIFLQDLMHAYERAQDAHRRHRR